MPVMPGKYNQGDLVDALDLTQTCLRELDGTIQYWSHGNEVLYGWTKNEAIGNVSHKLFKTVFPASLQSIQEELLESGNWKGDLRHVTKSGGEIWVLSNWILQRYPDGKPRLVIEVNNDVTDRRHADDTSRYLASIIESSDDAVVGKNLQGRITSWNAGAERLFEYTASEILGRPITQLFPPELIPEEAGIMAKLFRGERIEHYETTRLTKSGRRIQVVLTVSPIFDSQGELIGISKIARDITQKRALEKAFRSSEQRMRLAAEAGQLGFWTHDNITGAADWSPRCKTIFGLAADAPTPTYEESLRLLHPDDVERVKSVFEGSITEKRGFDMDFRVVVRGGVVRWVQSRGRPFFDEAGQVVQVHGTVLDFTKRKETEEALRRTNSQLQQFAYAAAHDLQEPLRNAALSIEMAKTRIQNTIPPESLILLDNAVGYAKQMQSMVKDLLAFSRALNDDDGAWPVIDTVEVLASALNNLAQLQQETAASITWDNLPPSRIHQVHLLQVFQNLISNSLKYRGTSTPVIHVGATAKGEFNEFFVKDNGIGVDPQYHNRIFGVFRRLQEVSASGTGIGLALCKRIVEHYGGRIWIESASGAGATFFFTLPAVTPEQVG